MILDEINIRTRLSDSLLFFYIALSTNFLVYLLPDENIKFIKNNLLIKYFLGYTTMMFSVYHISNIQNPINIIFITTILFIWFLMTIKLKPPNIIVIILLLVISFVINIKINSLSQFDYSPDKKIYLKKLKFVAFSIFIFTIILSTLSYFYSII